MKARKKVLLTGDTAGGVWTFIRELAADLSQDGVSVLLATFGPSVSEAQRAEAASIKGLEWRHHFSKLEWMDEPWPDIRRASAWLSSVVSDFDPDLIHLNTFCCAERRSNVPVVVTVHSSVAAWWAAVKQSPLPASWNSYQRQVKHALHSADVLTTPTETALCEVATFYNVDVSGALAIYNGSDSTVFRPAAKEPFILSAGRLWDEAKNSRALAQVSSGIKWPVYLAGSTVSPSHKEAVFPHCKLLGEMATPELARWYGRAGIYALPAKYEPFGLSALEAALSGCALVLGDIPSLREIWRDAAVFVSPDDPHSLQAALNGLILDKNLRAQMAKRALERASVFSHARMASAFRDAYQLASQRFEQLNRSRACAS